MREWTTWPNFDDDGEPDGKVIIGPATGEALFCSVAATDADVAMAAAAPELVATLEDLLDWLDRKGESKSAAGKEYNYITEARKLLAEVKGVSRG